MGTGIGKLTFVTYHCLIIDNYFKTIYFVLEKGPCCNVAAYGLLLTAYEIDLGQGLVVMSRLFPTVNIELDPGT